MCCLLGSGFVKWHMPLSIQDLQQPATRILCMCGHLNHTFAAAADQALACCCCTIVLCSEYSKTLNDARLKVLAARETAIQTVVREARSRVRDLARNPTSYKKLLQDLMVQVGQHTRRSSSCCRSRR